MIKKWVAFFSQTGSEILDISRKIDYFPDIVVTNNKFNNINKNLLDFYRQSETKSLIAVDDNITSSTYKRIIERHDDTLITLNGWLKIVPPDICESYKIYNGHPALISMYEDLKGKDPVDRLWENYHMYEYAGSVIHEVTADVDEGEIVSKHQFSLVDGYGKHLFNDFERLNSDVRKASLKLWVDFIRDNINI